MQALLQAVRKCCSANTWSRGVEMSRQGAVKGLKHGPDEIELQISLSALKSLHVVLWPEDLDWSCDCDSRDDACVHVAAAVIATHQARLAGLALPHMEELQTTLQYHFTRTPLGLALSRVLVTGTDQQVLQSSLPALAHAGKTAGLNLASHDVQIDRLVHNLPKGALPRRILHKCLMLLIDCEHVQLDLQPIRVDQSRPAKRLKLEKRAAGPWLSLETDPSIDEQFANGASLCGNCLHALEDISLMANEREQLERGRLITKDAMPHFISHVLPNLQQRIPLEIIGMPLPRVLTTPIQAAPSFSDDNFTLSFQSTDTHSPQTSIDGAAVLQAWQRGENLVQIMDGIWAPLPLAWLDQHGQQVLDLLAAKDPQGKLPAIVKPSLAALCDALNCPKPANLASLQRALEDFTTIPTAPLPQDLQAQLRDYQQQGVNWLKFLQTTGLGALLADDMGLGKTLQALCCLQPGSLVVAPTSVLYNWQQEIRKFRPGLICNVYHGKERALQNNADITLTTYALLRLDKTILAAQPWTCVVLDEAHNIKNPESQVAQAAFALQATFRLALTGTPIENRLDELWSQFHFINPGLLGGRQDFQQRFAEPLATGTSHVSAKLRERIKPFILRRLKQDVAPELPPRTDMILRCTLSLEERQMYDAIRAATMNDVVKQLEANGNVLAALEALLRLRQACCHAGLINPQYAKNSSKFQLLQSYLTQTLAAGHKALVFSQWTSLLDLLEPMLQSTNINHVRLDGQTRNRGQVIEQFAQTTGPQVMLISLKAGGTGLNLTMADHVFLLDPWWNPAVEDQAADRAHRIGQTKPVFVHKLIAEDTVEERIISLQQEKRAIAAAVLAGQDTSAGLTRNDLLSLLAAS